MPILQKDKLSGKLDKSGKPYYYSRKGDSVIIISQHDLVYIVENQKTKVRFSVKADEIN